MPVARAQLVGSVNLGVFPKLATLRRQDGNSPEKEQGELQRVGEHSIAHAPEKLKAGRFVEQWLDPLQRRVECCGLGGTVTAWLAAGRKERTLKLFHRLHCRWSVQTRPKWTRLDLGRRHLFTSGSTTSPFPSDFHPLSTSIIPHSLSTSHI